jgi:phage-related protein (TIGR01555 family)
MDIFKKIFKQRNDVSKKTKKLDNYYNQISGYGGTSSHNYNTVYNRGKILDRYQLEDLYDTNWLYKKIIDSYIDTALGKWIEFIDDEFANKYLDDDLFFQMQRVVTEAYKKADIFGGAAIFFDDGGAQDEPLISIDKTKIKRICVVEQNYCQPLTSYNSEIYNLTNKIGEVEHYNLTLLNALNSESFTVHESRLIKVQGVIPSSRRRLIENRGWGISKFEAMNEALKGFGVGMQSIADIMQNFFWRGMKLTDFDEMLLNGGASKIAELKNMLSIINNDSFGVCDKENEIYRESANVAGLSELIDRLTNQVCAASGIPHSILFSAEGGALGGTSAKEDIRNFNTKIRNYQNLRCRETINEYFKFLGLETPPEYSFKNIYEPTELEEVELLNKIAEIDAKNINSGVYYAEEAVERYRSNNTDVKKIIIDDELRAEILSLSDDGEDQEEGQEEEDK